MADTFGPQLGEMISRGPLFRGIGWDVADRLAFQNPLNRPRLDDFTAASWAKAGGELVTGAVGSQAFQIVGGAKSLMDGDIKGALLATLPRFFRDFVRAYELGTTGIVRRRDEAPVRAPEHISPYAIGLQALGIRPRVVGEFWEGYGARRDTQLGVADHRTQALRAYANAPPGDLRSALREVEAYNKRFPQYRLDYDTLYQARRRALTRLADPSTFGQTNIPERLRQQVDAAGRFANVR